MSDELLPCPFCGGAPSWHEGECCAHCRCGAAISCDLDKELGSTSLERWNRRVPDDALRAEVARLRGALEEIARPKYDGRTCSYCDHDVAVENPLCPGAIARRALEGKP